MANDRGTEVTPIVLPTEVTSYCYTRIFLHHILDILGLMLSMKEKNLNHLNHIIINYIIKGSIILFIPQNFRTRKKDIS